MKPIKDFVSEYLTRDHVQKLQGGPLWPDPKGWNEILESGGYISVQFQNTNDNTRQIAQWCREKFGAEHYYWTGGSFWFETEKAAVLFTLRWA